MLGGAQHGSTAAGSGGAAQLVDGMAWRKYCALVALYGFVGASPT